MLSPLEDLFSSNSDSSQLRSVFADAASQTWSLKATDFYPTRILGGAETMLDFGGDIFSSCFDSQMLEAAKAILDFKSQLAEVFQGNGLLAPLSSLDAGLMPMVTNAIRETMQGYGLLPVLLNLGSEGMLGELTGFFKDMVPGADIASLVGLASQLFSGQGLNGEQVLTVVGGIVGGMFGSAQLGAMAGKMLSMLSGDLAKNIGSVVSGFGSGLGEISDLAGGAAKAVSGVAKGIGKAISKLF